MDYVSGQDRHQMMMLSMDQMVHPESFARIIDAFVDVLDWNPEYALDNLLRLEIPAKSGTSGNFDAHRDDNHACASKLPLST